MNTTLFQHRFDSVEGYLHHRAPYLLIDCVEEIQDRSVLTSTTVREDAFFVQGHFPGAPILPGALMQEMTTQSAGVLLAANFNPMQEFNTADPFFNEYALGVLVKVNSGRYRGFARPGDRLEIHVEMKEQVGTLFDFSARIRCGQETIYRNAFQLTNIPSSVLQGQA
ncbi:MAG: 3-hydroxyacyl-ACP dehydratase FabZ family protein [Aureliella sp.]